jgi:hypothetical protein
VLVLSARTTSQAAAQETMAFALDEVESGVPSKAAALSSPDVARTIAQNLGARRWGMSKAELIAVLKAEIHAQFEQRIKVERDIMRQDALYQAAEERTRRLHSNYVEFDGNKTGWDVSPIAPEFSHGNSESMLVVTTDSSRDLYFFVRGKLWKWYRELSSGTGASASADELYDEVQARFGAGRAQREHLSEAHLAYPGVVWFDARTRVTLIRRGGEACLIFEDTGAADRLAALHKNAPVSNDRVRASKAVDWVLLPSDPTPEAEARK